MPKRVIRSSLLVSFLLCNGIKLPVYADDNRANALEQIMSKYGETAGKRYQSLMAIIDQNKERPEMERLICINNFFNQVPYQSDQQCWGESDYWATPTEMLGMGKADCEDYAIAKFFTLIELGIPEEKLFLTYAMTDNTRNKHVVLAYYENERSIPLILDNRRLTITREKIDKDYIPLYRFNLKHLMTYDQGYGRKSPIDMKQIAQWESVTKRL